MISKNFKKYTLYLIITLFAFGSCKKGGNPTVTHPTVPPVNTGPDVYVAGLIVAANGASVATYWKNGVAVKLTDSSSNAEALTIVVDGTDIYVSGFSTNPGYATPVPTYWKNGVATRAMVGTLSIYPSTMALSGPDVYLAGYTDASNTYQKATYWKNGAATLLPDNSAGSVADGIAVSGTDIYVSGFSAPPGNFPAAAYWKNGSATRLTDSSSWAEATAVTINGTDLYLAGYEKPIHYSVGATIGDPVATYWKNGVAKKLGDTTIYSQAFSILVSGTDIYIAGITASKGVFSPTYWKNGNTTVLNTSNLTSNFNNSTAAIAVNGSDVYVAAGYSGYWKNGVAVPFEKNSTVLGIAIVPH